MINNVAEGDEIDLKMFHFVQGEILEKEGKKEGEEGKEGKEGEGVGRNVIRVIKMGERRYEILRINEYESRFQSMSVLVRDRQTGRYFIFGKGSP